VNDLLDRWIAELTEARNRYQQEYEKLAVVAEDARRACVPVQQRLSKLNDALQSLEFARQWNTEEVPL